MFDPSSFADPTPLVHADTSRDVLPRGVLYCETNVVIESKWLWQRNRILSGMSLSPSTTEAPQFRRAEAQSPPIGLVW
ncbi:hypothetical protein TNCV_4225661 [Trichonephila clavipes]|uniref:Uncharacterized protein n=1 Tax=Trichonephila clavipes TaxID=2585209 RepID=A0A8X6SSJ1_TRICX|nr:hypothetical protein TNCV_4225661 [Trichonephila clavipes]